jgi:hypothetical protein
MVSVVRSGIPGRFLTRDAPYGFDNRAEKAAMPPTLPMVD